MSAGDTGGERMLLGCRWECGRHDWQTTSQASWKRGWKSQEERLERCTSKMGLYMAGPRDPELRQPQLYGAARFGKRRHKTTSAQASPAGHWYEPTAARPPARSVPSRAPPEWPGCAGCRQGSPRHAPGAQMRSRLCGRNQAGLFICHLRTSESGR